MFNYIYIDLHLLEIQLYARAVVLLRGLTICGLEIESIIKPVSWLRDSCN